MGLALAVQQPVGTEADEPRLLPAATWTGHKGPRPHEGAYNGFRTILSFGSLYQSSRSESSR